jgi:hypothetical protein
MSGAPQPDGFGTQLPTGFTSAFLVAQLAPGQMERRRSNGMQHSGGTGECRAADYGCAAVIQSAGPKNMLFNAISGDSLRTKFLKIT